MQKFKNVKKLLMKFSRGEELNVPTTSIAEIRIDGEGDGNSGEGAGLTGNLLDDWVNAVTQGEYTKYEDVPIGHTVETGVMEGWSRYGHDDDFALAPIVGSISSTYATLNNVINYEAYNTSSLKIYKDVAWEIAGSGDR